MDILLTGSVAYDYLMTFPGYFKEQILPERLASISLSFLVDSMSKQRGGVAPNIAYTMALLGERPHVMATVGEDFEEYRAWLPKASKVALVEVAPGEVARAPLSPFHPPEGLVVWRWPHCPPNSQKYCRATHLLLSDFRKFARFPHLGLACEEGEEVILEWLDLTFSVPGYRITYRLQVTLDPQGNLQVWRLSPFLVGRK